MEIAARHDSPSVLIAKGKIKIEGVCMPENAFEFFESIHAEIAAVVQKYDAFVIELGFTYLNSTSNKHILRILKTIEKKVSTQKVSWIFKKGDRLMEMKASEFNKFCPNFEFDMIEKA